MADTEINLIRDRDWLTDQQRRLQSRLSRNKPVDQIESRISQRLAESQRIIEARQQAVPSTIVFPEDLPVSERVDDLGAGLTAHQVLIVAGETGSGKSTQLPKLLLDRGYGIRGRIGVTQPRRIAARSLAARVAEELDSELGSTVGYQVRFADRLTDATSVKFMTDGILLAELQRDPLLLDYEAIIVDEAHERSLNIDFILGYLRQLLPRRPELKVIITSATIDTRKFADHFNDAEVIEVSGRGYPVDVVYRPRADKTDDQDRGLDQSILAAVEECTAIDRQGDILVFLATEMQIRDAARSLGRAGLKHTEILSLYGRLSNKAQQKVFHPGSARRIVLATNVAETSLTVPRIRFVIDGGEARIARYTARSGVQRLPIEAVSQASANQRKGRCGRVGPGTCIRLYSEEDFENRPEFTEPEILRTSLASVILQMTVMGLGDIQDFPFVDPPPPRMINDAWRQLFELQAVDEKRQVAALARNLSRWPMDVQLARMLLAGAEMDCAREMLVVTSFLSIQDPRERPLEAQAAADDAQQRWQNTQSDFMGILALWKDAENQRQKHSRRQFQNWCREHFLSPNRMREWFDLYRQLRARAREMKLGFNETAAEPDTIHQAVLTGLLSRVGRKTEDGDYEGPNGRKFLLFPGSGLYPKGPKWLMTAELVETRRLYARTCAAIQPAWLLRHASHLIKFSYLDPYWSEKRAEVMCKRQARLYGLVVEPGRRCRYGAVEPEEARNIFIRAALIGERLPADGLGFLVQNRAVRAELRTLEARRRRRDLLVSDEALFRFYNQRIPDGVFSQRQLQQWWKKSSAEQQVAMQLELSDLVTDADRLPDRHEYPDYLNVAGKKMELRYRFAPGEADDGITLPIPLALLPQLDAARLSWLVPGLRREKIEALLRKLPKAIRRTLGPAPNMATELLDQLGSELPSQSLPQWMAKVLTSRLGSELEAETLDEAEIEPYLRFRIEVLDGDDQILEAARDVADLQAQFGEAAQEQFQARVADDWQRDGLSSWPGDIETLPEEIETGDGLPGFPAFEDQGSSAALRVFGRREAALEAHPAGVRRLLNCGLDDKLRYLLRRHGLGIPAALAAAAVESLEDMLRGVFDYALRGVTDARVAAIRDVQSFKHELANLRPAILPAVTESTRLLDQILPACNRLMAGAEKLTGQWQDSRDDLVATVTDLIYPGFLYDLETGHLDHYPRYLEAAERRLNDISHHPGRDQERLLQIRPWWQRYQQAWQASPEFVPELDEFRWQLHEWRVSLFAQALGTPDPISEKRIRKSWEKVEDILE